MTCGRRLKKKCILRLQQGNFLPSYPEILPEQYQRPYRAPELLFGPRTYDAFATDIWSLGAVCAEFFTALRLTPQDEEFDERNNDIVVEEDKGKPFILPKHTRAGDPNARWRRDPLFNGRQGEIGLAWSIFKIRGTPTHDTWPVVKHLRGNYPPQD